MKRRLAVFLLLSLVLSLALGACGNDAQSVSQQVNTNATGGNAGATQITLPSKVTIAYQPGLGYAQLIVMKQQKVLETTFPRTTFEWKLLSNGASIRDGMIAGQIQLGALGIAPFLVGWDKGANWKILSALDALDIWLMTKQPDIQSLKDIKPGMKIGLPAPDSIQALVLRKAAQTQLNNPKALDANMISMEHPLGVQSLTSGQIAAHMTTPPFQFQETSAGARSILHSFDVFGQATSLGLFMTQSFYDKYPDFANWFYQQIKQSTDFIKQKPDDAAKLLSQEDQGKTSPEQYKTWMTDKSVNYDTVPHGLMAYSEFMKSTGFMNKGAASVKDFELPPLNGAGD
ncbi:MAG TPA: ABC transporter substrate-binding protein [Chloroflexia bacterium]|nr:ABC transporter substrate-binding protein [Chloroflexia bacterium]